VSGNLSAPLGNDPDDVVSAVVDHAVRVVAFGRAT
jgi:hypothetical protein